MNDQTNVKTAFACSLFSWPVLIPEAAIEVSAESLGYEISEEELARELSIGTSNNFPGEPALQVDPEEFEAIYTWFLS